MFIGVLVHHTAGPATGDAPTLGMIRNGRSGLPGPLANYYLSRSGIVFHITEGRANHAGRCSSIALQRIAQDLPPEGDAADVGLSDDTVGNSYLIGIEVEHPGDGSPYPANQIESLAILCAELCRNNGWSANRVWHHREVTRRKIDMSFRGDLRGRVAQILGGPAAPQTTPQPDFVIEKDEDMKRVIAYSGNTAQYGGTVWLLRGRDADPLDAQADAQFAACVVPGPFRIDVGVLKKYYRRGDGQAW